MDNLEMDEDSIINNVMCVDGQNVSTPDRATTIIDIRCGMEFATFEDIQYVYGQYAKLNGFHITIRNSREKIRQLVCYREGFAYNRKRQGNFECDESNRRTKTSKTGCRACLFCSLDSKSNAWRIAKFIDDHNHEMVTPKSRKFLKAHKNMSTSAKSLAMVFDNEGISVAKVTSVMHANPEDAEFTRKDCYNFISSIRKKILDNGDAQAVYIWCTRQQELDPEFRFSIQLDEDDRMLNLFWVDARSKAAYRTFGDVVSFDTTYKTNKYGLPFAPFVGLDNHLQNILFGCALLQDETDSSFIWLFNTWLHAMDDKMPKAIVTDQDRAMMNAVGKVFPDSRHRLCLWHITKKFPERLAHIYHSKSSFKGAMNQCLHESVTPEEFEDSWARLVCEYGLESNDWLKNLFDMRHMWVPIFSKEIFFGGMNTTGRSESINSFFDDFVNSSTTLKEFVEKYGKALETRYETYRQVDFESRHKSPIMTLGMGLEEHASQVYTNEIILKFHAELCRILSYTRELVEDNYPLKSFQVKTRHSLGSGYMVEYNVLTLDAKCQCMKFEFQGILCRHILSVYYVYNIEHIPQQYILSRWTKDVGRVLWDYSIARDRHYLPSIDHFQIKASYDILCDICGHSKDLAEFVKKGMDALVVSAQARQNDMTPTPAFVVPTQSSAQQSSPSILDPQVAQTKGRKKNSLNRATRIRSGLEIATDPSVKCSLCMKTGHNRRTCPTARIP